MWISKKSLSKMLNTERKAGWNMARRDYNRGFNDAIDILQIHRYRKKGPGELFRVGFLLDYFQDKGRH
jgi:hypothetical protein